MTEKLTEKQLRSKRRWFADMAAVSEALDRLGVPPHTKMRMSEARFAPDEEPCPALMERLGWLEGHVAFLRGPEVPPTQDVCLGPIYPTATFVERSDSGTPPPEVCGEIPTGGDATHGFWCGLEAGHAGQHAARGVSGGMCWGRPDTPPLRICNDCKAVTEAELGAMHNDLPGGGFCLGRMVDRT